MENTSFCSEIGRGQKIQRTAATVLGKVNRAVPFQNSELMIL